MNEKDPITLTKGEKAPNFSLPAINSDGTEIEIKLNEELVSKKVLLVFYQDDGMHILIIVVSAFSSLLSVHISSLVCMVIFIASL